MNTEQYDAYDKLVAVACQHGGEKARTVILEYLRGSTIESNRKFLSDFTELLNDREKRDAMISGQKVNATSTPPPHCPACGAIHGDHHCHVLPGLRNEIIVELLSDRFPFPSATAGARLIVGMARKVATGLSRETVVEVLGDREAFDAATMPARLVVASSMAKETDNRDLFRLKLRALRLGELAREDVKDLNAGRSLSIGQRFARWILGN